MLVVGLINVTTVLKPDLGTFVVSIMLLAFAAVVASYLPVRRVAKVDPMVTLCYE
jgi:ABC-type lipoprotein release transport system permease subunit